MKVLLLGGSRIVRRRVLPALRSMAEVTGIAVASHTAGATDLDGLEPFRDYEAAIVESNAELAYVSVANSDHARWVERALNQGMHVVVDKPSYRSVDDAHRLADIAQKKRRCLAEATVFPFHPQIEAATREIGSVGAHITRVSAVFSFPPLDPSDFRYCKDKGGGALWDIGPYAVATSRIFFKSKPVHVSCQRVARRPSDGLDLAFSVLMTYPEEGSLIGHFGFDTEYQNRLSLLGPDILVDINRAFTLPPNQSNRLFIRNKNVESELAIEPTDSFKVFLSTVINGIARGQWKEFVDALVDDSELLDLLRQVCGEH